MFEFPKPSEIAIKKNINNSPSIFHKFHGYNTFLFQVLMSQQLHCSDYEKLNDPYDTRLIFTDSYIQRMFKDKSAIKVNINDVFKDFMKKLNNGNRFVKLTENSHKAKFQVIDAFYSDFVAVLLKYLNYNVVSFTVNKHESENDILMWSHYTAISKGVKLTFDFSAGASRLNILQFLNKVEYKGLPEVDNIDDVQKALFKKTRVWEYEQEYRIVRREKKQPFDANSLKEITFGYNIGKEDRETLIKIMLYSRYHWVKFYRIIFVKGKLKREEILIEKAMHDQKVITWFKLLNNED
jgi:hypothetical protein